MEFKLNNLKYAWVGNKLRHIVSGNKSDKYFLDENLTIPLVFCKGVKIKSYWRKEPNVDDSVIRDFFGSSESVEHYNAKIKISIENTFSYIDYVYDGSYREVPISFVGKSSQVEYMVKEINKFIDVVLFDENNKPLIGIEVLCTNKKTDEDIKKFNKVNFPIYEYNINTEESYPISAGNTDTEQIRILSEQIRHYEESINKDKPNLIKGESILGRQQGGIKRLEKGIKRLDERRRKEWREYYKIKETAEYLSDEGFDKVIREQDRIIASFQNKIKEYRGKREEHRLLEEIMGIEEEVERTERESRIIQSELAKENRREFELREELRKDINAF
jgi:hypothetical protein